MGSVNKVLLVGYLGRDAEVRFTAGGVAIAKFSMATTEVWNDKAGQRQERTEWHYVDLWGKGAESLKEYLVKGKQVYVEGKIQTSEYTDKDGVKRKATNIRADRIVLLGGGDRTGQRPAHVRDEDVGRGEPVMAGGGGDLDDSDIPFSWLIPLIVPVMGLLGVFAA